jgi:hypothetical protein
VVVAGGPGDSADGMDLGDQGLALAVGLQSAPAASRSPRATLSAPTMAPTGRPNGAWQANTSSGQVTTDPMP